MRGVGAEDPLADLFKAGGELDGLYRARRQGDIGDAVVFQADVDHQFVGVVLNGFDEHPRFEFGVAHAHIADHRLHQREAPQRFRDVQRFALDAVNKQLQIFASGNARRPVRIRDTGAAHRHQVVAVIQTLLGIGRVHYPAHAHHRHLSQGFGAHGAIFFNQRRGIGGIDNRGSQRGANREVEIVDAAGGQLFQQIHGVSKTDTGDFHLFRGEPVADNKGIIGVLAGHFVGDVQYRQREFRAIIAAAAPFIVALVRVWRIKLLDQIGVRAVNLDAVETGLNGAAYAFAKLRDHALDFSAAQRAGGCCAIARRGNRARGNRLASADKLRVDHPAAVVDLQNRF